jgi:hypothetical protein
MTVFLWRFTLRITILFVTAVASADPAHACACSGPGPACQELWTAAAVFVGKVDTLTLQGNDVVVTFSVQEWFRGTETRTVTVRTPSAVAACGYVFRSGRQYLVYAASVEGRSDLITTRCSRTQPLERAASDLAYARGLPSDPSPAARIFGRVVQRSRDLGRRRDRDRLLPGALVSVLGAESVLQLQSDAMGVFSAGGLANGRYTSTIASPDGISGVIAPSAFELTDRRACVALSAIVHAAATVRGRVIDASGNALPGLTIELTVPDALERNPDAERVRTLSRGDGTFALRGVPDGRFIVGINTTRGSTPRLIYPGVDSLKAATVITVRANDDLELHDFVIPANISFVTIPGMVRDSAGVPAAGARVFLAGPLEGDHILGEPAVTDSGGRFVLSVPAGRRYRLFAERTRAGSGNRLDATDVISVTASVGGTVQLLTLRALH